MADPPIEPAEGQDPTPPDVLLAVNATLRLLDDIRADDTLADDLLLRLVALRLALRRLRKHLRNQRGAP